MNVLGDTAIYGNPALAIEDFSSKAFTLYPNPVSEKLFLDFSEETGLKKVEVFDVRGVLIRQYGSFQNSLIEIDTAHFNSGLYFINVVDSEGQVAVKQFIKK